jgi:hypothetical protein
MKPTPEIGKGMKAWARGLKASSPELAKRLDRPREEGWRLLEELDLPRYERVVAPVKVFLDDPSKTIEPILSDLLFVFFAIQGRHPRS